MTCDYVIVTCDCVMCHVTVMCNIILTSTLSSKYENKMKIK